jgi:hypothetical protein
MGKIKYNNIDNELVYNKKGLLLQIRERHVLEW